MSAVPGASDKPRSPRSWWQDLWRRPPIPAPPASTALVPAATATDPGGALQGGPAPAARITRETLMRLQAAGPPPEPPPDLLQQRASFWAAATHDLCQPAQALALFLERLRRLPAQTPAPALHGYLQSSMEDLTRLLTALMELAQIDAGEVQAAAMVVSVDEVLARVHGQLAAQAQAKGLRLAVRSHGQSVAGDAALIERILLALGRNAVQFCPQGTVLLSARTVHAGTALRLDVSDSGPGIAERDHRLIFEPFAQRNAARAQGPTRPSLGLHIASRHAALMGTQLQLRSALGRGSRFSMTLPLVDVRLRSGGGVRSHALDSLGLDGLCVALIDTDEARAAQVGGWLRSWGCVLAGDLHADGASPPPVQAIICAWQADAPGQAVVQIAALRSPQAGTPPACIIYAASDRPVRGELPAATTVLGPTLQAAQLRAWLRRVAVR